MTTMSWKIMCFTANVGANQRKKQIQTITSNEHSQNQKASSRPPHGPPAPRGRGVAGGYSALELNTQHGTIV